MGHKLVCLDCRKSFSSGTDFTVQKGNVCPDCGKQMTMLPHRFRPPKKNDDKKWETVKYLIGNGFYYQHIYESDSNTKLFNVKKYAMYPESLKDAKEFVEKFKAQARK